MRVAARTVDYDAAEAVEITASVREVVVVLARVVGLIPSLPHQFGDGLHVCRQVNLVLRHPARAHVMGPKPDGVPTRHYRGARRCADRHRGIGALEDHPVTGQCIDIGRRDGVIAIDAIPG